jgi:hypothetical protein
VLVNSQPEAEISGRKENRGCKTAAVTLFFLTGPAIPLERIKGERFSAQIPSGSTRGSSGVILGLHFYKVVHKSI